MHKSYLNKIVLSQRVEEFASYKERRDCLDQKWFILLRELNLFPVPAPNSLDNFNDWLSLIEPDGIILTGGNNLDHLQNVVNTAPERDRTERLMLDYAYEHELPVLGVCRGFQMMNVYLGGMLKPLKGHTALYHAVNAEPNEPLFCNYQNVNSYHDWGMDGSGLSKDLKAVVHSKENGSIEAAKHRHLPWNGIMWHPERETPFNSNDKNLINKTFNTIK